MLRTPSLFHVCSFWVTADKHGRNLNPKHAHHADALVIHSWWGMDVQLSNEHFHRAPKKICSTLMGYRTRLGNAKWSSTSYFSPSLVTMLGLIHLAPLKSPNSPCGMLPGLSPEEPSELCPSPWGWMSQRRMSLWGWSKGPSFRFAESRSPGKGCGEETSSQGCRVGKQIPVAKEFLSPKIIFYFEIEWVSPHPIRNKAAQWLSYSSEHHCSNLL